MVDFHDDILSPVQKAFSKQAIHYDQSDSLNPILQDWRNRVYKHVNRFLKPRSRILELNAGTGIDALHFVNDGHTVLATDFSPGMIAEIKKKIKKAASPDHFTVKQCSFESLTDSIDGKFDYVFSNFGGLNCSADLSKVVSGIKKHLVDGGFVTWVIMPRICPWEIGGLLRGKKNSLRRLQRGGAYANLEGENFQTHYYSLVSIKETFGEDCHLVRAEGLGALSPPPSSLAFIRNYPHAYSVLNMLDRMFAKSFPFNRWADHIIVTFQYRSPA
ncbi:MAG TPA: methyltransferase domain-containing protein [Cyclobacteriaceae bacterium]|nr:methyltransferase domain-containing protein [Cyclobacteriaceae bacterium]